MFYDTRPDILQNLRARIGRLEMVFGKISAAYLYERWRLYFYYD